MIAHKLPATTNKSIWIMGETACVGEDLTGDVNLSKTWRENYSIVRFKLKKTKKSIWCAVKMARICSIFKGGGVVRLYFFFFQTNLKQHSSLCFACPLVLLFTLWFVCSAVHCLLLYRSVCICIPMSMFTFSMSHLVSISPSLLLLHKCLSHVIPNTETGE